ncbi:cation transporter [Rhizobium sp. CAU 1783]
MSESHGHSHGPFDGMSDTYKRRLWAVIFINAAMFVVEMTAGQLARSQALQADALDFFADAVTYGISLAVIGASLKVRSTAAAAKGISLFFMGFWVFGSTVWRVFFDGMPEAPVMGAIGFMALAANVTSVLLLMNYKDGDANVRSVWLCSRNDAIGNVIVMIAALGVWGTATAWPDLAVAFIMAGLFLNSSAQILWQSWQEWKTGGAEAFTKAASQSVCGCSHDHGPDQGPGHGHSHDEAQGHGKTGHAHDHAH